MVTAKEKGKGEGVIRVVAVIRGGSLVVVEVYYTIRVTKTSTLDGEREGCDVAWRMGRASWVINRCCGIYSRISVGEAIGETGTGDISISRELPGATSTDCRAGRRAKSVTLYDTTHT